MHCTAQSLSKRAGGLHKLIVGLTADGRTLASKLVAERQSKRPSCTKKLLVDTMCKMEISDESKLDGFYRCLFYAFHALLQLENERQRRPLTAQVLQDAVFDKVTNFLDYEQILQKVVLKKAIDFLDYEQECLQTLCALEVIADGEDPDLCEELQAAAEGGSWNSGEGAKGGSWTHALEAVQNAVDEAVKQTAVRQHLTPIFSHFGELNGSVKTQPLSLRCGLADAIYRLC